MVKFLVLAISKNESENGAVKSITASLTDVEKTLTSVNSSGTDN